MAVHSPLLTLLLVFLCSCTCGLAAAPKFFQVKVSTTAQAGNKNFFVLNITRSWAPIGVDRFYKLVRSGYFNDNAFFRVVPGFVVQFGLNGNPAITAKWEHRNLKDDPVSKTNKPGTITFATAGANTRTTQLFINLGDNTRLDGMGFSPFGLVADGFDVVKAITSQYAEQPDQGQITSEGNEYLKKNFPKLDYIKEMTIMPLVKNVAFTKVRLRKFKGGKK